MLYLVLAAGYARAKILKVIASTATRSTTRRSGDQMGDQIAHGNQIDDQIFDVTKI